jgi:hypothetical protein
VSPPAPPELNRSALILQTTSNLEWPQLEGANMHGWTNQHRWIGVLTVVICLLLTNDISVHAQRRTKSRRTTAAKQTTAQPKTVKVKFETGIYRAFDHSWMGTAPEDVIATVTSSAGTSSKNPDDRGLVIFNNIPCGEEIRINIRFVGTGDYTSNSRDYARKVDCRRALVNLGRLEYGKW